MDERLEDLLQEKLDDAYNEGELDALENLIDIINCGYEQVVDELNNCGATFTEIALSEKLFNMFMSKIVDMINDDYGCDEDCECCEFCEECC